MANLTSSSASSASAYRVRKGQPADVPRRLAEVQGVVSDRPSHGPQALFASKSESDLRPRPELGSHELSPTGWAGHLPWLAKCRTSAAMCTFCSAERSDGD